MTHRHAFKRGVAPRPSEADIRAWRRLIKRALAVGVDPGKPGKPFSISADKAAKAILPVGHQGPDGVFTRLVRIGKRWLVITGTERQALGAEVRELARDCAEILDGAPGELRRLPYAED